MPRPAKEGSRVTREMRERRGVWSETSLSPPIGRSDIRRWAIAVYWPEAPPRLYWDEEYARTTRWKGIIAPPDFNPFAWPLTGDSPWGTPRSLLGIGRGGRAWGSGVGARALNGGQVDTYGEPMRPGDVIASRARLVDWEERSTRLGPTLFVFIETEWRNQRESFVRKRLQTVLNF